MRVISAPRLMLKTEMCPKILDIFRNLHLIGSLTSLIIRKFMQDHFFPCTGLEMFSSSCRLQHFKFP